MRYKALLTAASASARLGRPAFARVVCVLGLTSLFPFLTGLAGVWIMLCVLSGPPTSPQDRAFLTFILSLHAALQLAIGFPTVSLLLACPHPLRAALCVGAILCPLVAATLIYGMLTDLRWSIFYTAPVFASYLLAGLLILVTRACGLTRTPGPEPDSPAHHRP